MITEIGAVKVRGGEVLGEFQTLVNPRTEIPPFIAVLTGITNAHGRATPRRSSRRCRRSSSSPPGACWWPTTRRSTSASSALRRRSRAGRGRRSRCSTPPCWPAAWSPATRRPTASSPRWRGSFRSTTTPNHRALDDARATVDVLHGLMERLGGLGVHTLEELQTFSSRVSSRPAPQAPPRRGAPARPGRLPVPRRPRRGCSTSARPATCAPGSAPTSPPPRPGPGWARWSALAASVDGDRVRDRRSRPRSASCG